MPSPNSPSSTAAKAQPLHLVPAYGRDYKTSLSALADWKAGKDFLISDISSPYNGAYCSCRDFTRIQRVMIRYNKLADFVITGGLKPRTKRSFVPPAPRRVIPSIIAAITLAISLAGCNYMTMDDCEEATGTVCHMNLSGRYSQGPGIDINSPAGQILLGTSLQMMTPPPSYDVNLYVHPY